MSTFGQIFLCFIRPNKDFGILFDAKQKFNSYINNIINMSHKILSFINLNLADFTNKYTLKLLYCSIMPSVCEYGTIYI